MAFGLWHKDREKARSERANKSERCILLQALRSTERRPGGTLRLHGRRNALPLHGGTAKMHLIQIPNFLLAFLFLAAEDAFINRTHGGHFRLCWTEYRKLNTEYFSQHARPKTLPVLPQACAGHLSAPRPVC